MKKLFLMLAMMLPVCLFSGCSDDEDEAVYASSIVGTWKSYQQYVEDAPISHTGKWMYCDYVSYTFNSDFTYTNKVFEREYNGTYEVNGNQICIDGGFWEDFILSEDKTKLEFNNYRFEKVK